MRASRVLGVVVHEHAGGLWPLTGHGQRPLLTGGSGGGSACVTPGSGHPIPQVTVTSRAVVADSLAAIVRFPSRLLARLTGAM